MRVQNAIDGSVLSLALDGKVQVTRYEARGLPCAAPEVFTYRTRVRPTLPAGVPFGYAYAQGEVSVNGTTKLAFTGLPSPNPENVFDSRARLDITSPNLPAASFDLAGLDDRAVFDAARCSP